MIMAQRIKQFVRFYSLENVGKIKTKENDE